MNVNELFWDIGHNVGGFYSYIKTLFNRAIQGVGLEEKSCRQISRSRKESKEGKSEEKSKSSAKLAD